MEMHTELPYQTVQRKKLYTQAFIYMLRYIALHGPVSLYKAIKKTSEKFGINFEAYRAYVLRNLKGLEEELILEVTKKNRKNIVDIGPRGLYVLYLFDKCWLAWFTVLARKDIIPEDFVTFLCENAVQVLRKAYEEYCLGDKPSEIEISGLKKDLLYLASYRIRTFSDVFTIFKQSNIIFASIDLSNPDKLEKSVKKLKPYTKAFIYTLTKQHIDYYKKGIKVFEEIIKKAEFLLKLCS